MSLKIKKLCTYFLRNHLQDSGKFQNGTSVETLYSSLLRNTMAMCRTLLSVLIWFVSFVYRVNYWIKGVSFTLSHYPTPHPHTLIYLSTKPLALCRKIVWYMRKKLMMHAVFCCIVSLLCLRYKNITKDELCYRFLKFYYKKVRETPSV